mgnify:CR=1 FL=1
MARCFSRVVFSIGTLLILQSASAQVPLWIDAPTGYDAAPREADPAIVRRRAIQLDTGNFNSLHEAGSRRSIQLFDSVTRTIAIDRMESTCAGGHSWLGRFEEEPGSFLIMSRHQESVAAHLMLPSKGVFEVRYLTDGMHELVQIDPDLLPGCGCSKEHQIEMKEPEPALPRSGDSGALIDVLVLYTTASRISAGGTASIQSLISNAISQTNFAYGNSLITPRLRLVHMAETTYVDSFDMDLDLNRLTTNGDGHMDEAHTLRDTYGADLVALIINYTTEFCGLAWINGYSSSYAPFGFSVTARQCATGNWTFSHELGHNQGCAHDRDNAGGPGAFSYSYGHRLSGNAYRTIMAYPPGNILPHYSNPNVLHNGIPTGVPIGQPLEAHNAQTINLMASVVGNFRKALPDDLIPPQPNPMTFSVAPAPVTTTSITMSATAGIDDTPPVRYYFEETSGGPGANSSGWQLVSSYVDGGLNPNTRYVYRVKARDSAPTVNEGSFSEEAETATHIQTPGQLGAITLSATSVQILAPGVFTNLNLGLSGILFEADPPGDYTNVNVWNSATSVVVSGLMPGRLYSFRAKARNQYGVETGWSPLTYVETFPLIGDCNDDGVFDLDGDLPCFVDALLGIESFPGAIERSDINFDGFTDALDIPDMIFCLVYAACN